MTFPTPHPHALPRGMNAVTRSDVRKAAQFLGILAMAGSLAACGDDDHKKDKDAQLVQGRDACIDTLVQAGRTKDDAANICDKALADATVREAQNGTYHGDSSGYYYNNYYLINRSDTSVPPAIYRQRGSSFVYVGGGRTQTYTPPTELDEARAGYLRTSPTERAAAASRAAAAAATEESGRTGSYSNAFGEEEGHVSSSFGARSSFGISRGGFGAGIGG